MNLREALLIALDALGAVGASSGSPKDRSAIRDFRRDPDNADDAFSRIMGIELRKLFGFNEEQFKEQRSALLQELTNRYENWLRAHEVEGGPLEVDLSFRSELEAVCEDIEFCANHPNHQDSDE